MRKQLLINWVYYDPIGHVLEALQNAHGYHVANPDVEISLLVNADAVWRITDGCPWLAHVYPVSLAEIGADGENAPSLQAVPPSWDYVVHDSRVMPGALVEGWDEEDLMVGQPVIQRYLRAKEWSGASPGFEVLWNTTGLLATETPLPFQANATMRLQVPEEARQFVQRYRHDGPTICLLPVSTSGVAQSPSPQAWEQICAALADAFPNLRIYITGITYINEQGKRVGFDFGPEDVRRIGQRVPGVVDCFDIGMWNQIALMEQCDLFCSTHTGFAFSAQFVGTPWLVISGCPWAEYLLNGVPFYSALPDCPNYPAYMNRDSACMHHWHNGTQPDCISDHAIQQRIPDVVQGARLLMQGQLSFADACRLHIDKLRSAGRNPKHFLYFDWSP